MTTLVACSHGTSDPAGREVVAAIVAQVREQLAGVRVVAAFVDVEEPAVDDVVREETRRDAVVVVPLLLSAGFHTAVDIARAVAAHPNARQAAPLGTHPLIARVLRHRLREAIGDWRAGDQVVLAAAGSSNPAAAVDAEAVAARLRALVPAPVRPAFASAAAPRIPDAVAEARAAGARRVIAASHVLAPGYFAGLVRTAGADVVSAPLGADPRVATVVADRFRAAGATL